MSIFVLEYCDRADVVGYEAVPLNAQVLNVWEIRPAVYIPA